MNYDRRDVPVYRPSKSALLFAAAVWIIIMLIGWAAFAGNERPSGPRHTPPIAHSSSMSSSTAAASARLTNQTMTTATGGGGGNVSIGSIGTGSGGGAGRLFGAPSITVPDYPGQAPCGGGFSLGGIGLGGGGSGGGGLFEFGDCKRMRESAALLHLGFRQAALNELCQIGRVLEAFGGHCPDIAAASELNERPDYCYTQDAGDGDRQHRRCFVTENRR